MNRRMIPNEGGGRQGRHLLFLVSMIFSPSRASLTINEVAYKGSPDACDGKDWVEIYNDGASPVDLLNHTLHDDKGLFDEDAKFFSESTPIDAGEYKVLCRKVDFDFGIGGDDVVTLLDGDGNVLSEASLLGSGGDDQTFAFFADQEPAGYLYTDTPTPGGENVHAAPQPLEEKLREQNEAGDEFFLVDGSDDAVYDKVVDIHVQVSNESLAVISDHPTWEEFVPFTEISVTNPSDPDVVVYAGEGGGQMRTKGQSTLMITACLGLKNVPFQLEFDAPFLGMEVVYLRNHLSDPSYMRDAASHVLLKKFGLPYLRTRPVRLYLNEEYVGFYTLIEAPVQAYVLQRSFGAFDPEKTALYKMKTIVGDCPVTDPATIERSEARDTPDPYYFNRGDHRVDPPFGGDMNECGLYFFGEIAKEGEDLSKGILEYNNSCGEALVGLGRVDRDYGPKSTEDVMVDFVDSVMLNQTLTDIKGRIDADQWIKNFAAYAVTLNTDSVIGIVNNWYLATLDHGESWKIVQYDHNLVASRAGGLLCSPACGNRAIYHPIMRPTCGAVEEHPVLARVLNDEESWQTYLKYVEEFVGVVDSSIDELRTYGNDIKSFIVDDPYSYEPLFGELIGTKMTVESYEESELGSDYSDYNTESMPLLKTLSARLDEVNAQLEAIKSETLPRGGVYGKGEMCPDWRDEDGADYFAGSTFDDTCGKPLCAQAAPCYDGSIFACWNGEIVNEDCKAITPICDDCFPFSPCGTLEETSSKFDEETCGGVYAGCALGANCFDHKSGVCAYDGSILTEECREADLNCKACFPDSRCGALRASEETATVTGQPSTSPVKSAEETATGQPSTSPVKSAEETATGQPTASPIQASEETTTSQPSTSPVKSSNETATSPGSSFAKIELSTWIGIGVFSLYWFHF